MRDVFPGYYKPTDEQLSELWSDALVVLDTNALFNLFRYTNSTREAFLNVLTAKRSQLWLPHQVGLEFQKGRLRVIDDQEKAFEDLIGKSRTALASVTKDVGTLRNHPTLDLDELRAAVDEAIATVEHTIETTRRKYQTEVLDSARHAKTTDIITELYTGKVGQPYKEDQLAQLYEQGKHRYEVKRPPGYKDVNKQEPDRYGDFILWMQLLDKAEEDNRSVIFVGDDQKEDWWREFKGRKIGPRVELIDEFMERVGERIFFVTPQALMTLAREHDAEITDITPAAVTEVANVSEAQARLAALEREERRLRKRTYFPSEVEIRLADLIHEREAMESELRVRIRRAMDLADQGKDGFDDLAENEQFITMLRGRVAELSGRIKEAEQFQHFGASRGTRTAGRPGIEFLAHVRRQLMLEGYPPIMGDDWMELSPSAMADLVTHADDIDPEFGFIVERARLDFATADRRGKRDPYETGDYDK